MNNLAYQIEQPQLEVNRYRIQSDIEAERVLHNLKEILSNDITESDFARQIAICKAQIEYYQDKIRQQEEKRDREAEYCKGLLQEYFSTVPHKATKTQEIYKLPSGTLRLKHREPELKRDDKELVEFLKQHNYKDFLETKYIVKWAELKKDLIVDGEYVIDTECGLTVKGVTVVEREPEFVID